MIMDIKQSFSRTIICVQLRGLLDENRTVILHQRQILYSQNKKRMKAVFMGRFHALFLFF